MYHVHSYVGIGVCKVYPPLIIAQLSNCECTRGCICDKQLSDECEPQSKLFALQSFKMSSGVRTLLLLCFVFSGTESRPRPLYEVGCSITRYAVFYATLDHCLSISLGEQ